MLETTVDRHVYHICSHKSTWLIRRQTSLRCRPAHQNKIYCRSYTLLLYRNSCSSNRVPYSVWIQLIRNSCSSNRVQYSVWIQLIRISCSSNRVLCSVWIQLLTNSCSYNRVPCSVWIRVFRFGESTLRSYLIRVARDFSTILLPYYGQYRYMHEILVTKMYFISHMKYSD
jgi:hypothetical protein